MAAVRSFDSADTSWRAVIYPPLFFITYLTCLTFALSFLPYSSCACLTLPYHTIPELSDAKVLYLIIIIIIILITIISPSAGLISKICPSSPFHLSSSVRQTISCLTRLISSTHPYPCLPAHPLLSSIKYFSSYPPNPSLFLYAFSPPCLGRFLQACRTCHWDSLSTNKQGTSSASSEKNPCSNTTQSSVLMSSKPSPGSAQSDPRNIYYPTRLASGYGMMAETQRPQSTAHTLPPPPSVQAGSRQLPPPSHLEPSFVPQSPQVRPQYSDLPTRHYPVYERQSPHGQPPTQDFRQAWPASAPPGLAGHVSSFAHPPLYPSKASYQSTNPGTVYEALSPVRYGTDEPPPEASLFNEGAYSTNTFPAGHSSHQSPASSYRSSVTSSSGQGTGPMQFPKPTSLYEAPTRPGDM